MTEAPLRARILALLAQQSGLTDRQLTDQLVGVGQPQQGVNSECRKLRDEGTLQRRPRFDGLTGNYPLSTQVQTVSVGGQPVAKKAVSGAATMSEDEVKRHIETWLHVEGWQDKVQWGHERGIDIEARRGAERWVIEAKGCGSLQPMRVNYFIGMLGETLQRMDDPAARYSIALPDLVSRSRRKARRIKSPVDERRRIQN